MSAAAIRALHDDLGLTWLQVGRLFGTGARTVHSWASGAPMSGTHRRRLAAVQAATANVPGYSPADKRRSLLSPTETGRSLFDELRAQKYGGQEINPSIF